MLSQLFRPVRRPAPDQAIRDQMERLLSSAGLRTAPRLQMFLRFVVERSLEGRDGEIKEASVGVEVFGKAPGYDSRSDSTVRVEAAKLRQRLTEYYEGEGTADPVRISIPKGAYIASIDLAKPVQSPLLGRWLPLLGLAAAAACAVWWLWPATPDVIDPGRLRITRLTEPGSFSSDVAPSLDGKFVVYATDREAGDALNLWKQPVDWGPPARLTRSGWNHSMPTVSRSGTIVYRTSEEGGVLAALHTSGARSFLKDSARARNPRFSPRGEALAYWIPRDEETRDYGSVFLRNLDTPQLAPARLFGEFAHASLPLWSDRGTHLLTLGTWQSNELAKEFDAWMVALDGLHAKGLPVKTGLFPKLRERKLYLSLNERKLIELGDWRDGWLYFTIPAGEAADVYRIRLDPAAGAVAGEPQRITLSSGTARGPRLAAMGLVFADAETSYDLFSLPVPRERESALELRKHTSETGMNFRPSVDPSGRSMVWERRRPGASDQILFHDLAGGRPVQLAQAVAAATSHVLLTPDGRSAAYRLQAPGLQPILLEPVAGGPPQRICENCGMPSDWSPDGSHLWYVTGGHPAAIGLLHVKTGRHADSLKHPSYNLYGARQHVDANGDGWLAFYADNGPLSRQIYLAPIRQYRPGEPDSWIAATTGAQWDVSPAWAPDGNTLYFVSRRDGFSCIMAQRLDPATKRPVGTAWTVHHFHGPRQSLMRTSTNRGSDALWVANGRIYFTLDNATSGLRLLSGLHR